MDDNPHSPTLLTLTLTPSDGELPFPDLKNLQLAELNTDLDLDLVAIPKNIKDKDKDKARVKVKLIKRVCMLKSKLQIKNSPFGNIFCGCYCGNSRVTEECENSIASNDDLTSSSCGGEAEASSQTQGKVEV